MTCPEGPNTDLGTAPPRRMAQYRWTFCRELPWGLCRVQGLGAQGVWGFGFRVQGLGFRVWRLGFRLARGLKGCCWRVLLSGFLTTGFPHCFREGFYDYEVEDLELACRAYRASGLVSVLGLREGSLRFRALGFAVWVLGFRVWRP